MIGTSPNKTIWQTPVSELRFPRLKITIDNLLIAGFIAVIMIPWPCMFFHKRSLPTVPANNEAVAQFPVLQPTINSFLSFPKDYRSFFQENFGFRRSLIALNAFLKVDCMGISSSQRVTIGRDGFLFNMEKDYYIREIKPLTKAELAHIKSVYESRRDWLAKRGIHYLVIIPPEKYTMYEDKMPPLFHRIYRPKRIDQFYNYMKRNSTVDILDLRPALNAQKKNYLLYRKTDTHWNDMGGFFAYQAIISRLSQWYPDIHPMPLSDFNIEQQPLDIGDSAIALGNFKKISEECPSLVKKVDSTVHFDEKGGPEDMTDTRIVREVMVSNKANGEIPRVVMFRDSFAYGLIPFLAEHFNHAVYQWEFKFDTETIEREHPDLVIQERVERALLHPLPATGAPLTDH